MKTSSKLRRIQRRIKLRRQRSAFFMILLISVVMMATSVFSKPDTAAGEVSVISVTVHPGDTLWTIAERYKPSGMDVRKFMHNIAANNGLTDYGVISGQKLFVPVS